MKLHRRWFFWIIVLAAAGIGMLYFTQRHNRGGETKMYFSYNMEGAKSSGKLGIQTAEVNSHVPLHGVVCVNRATDVSKIDLFMPDMGHGSRPPIVARISSVPKDLNLSSAAHSDYGCFHLSKMEMFMPGVWQVRVFYQDGEQGYFNLDLKS